MNVDEVNDEFNTTTQDETIEHDKSPVSTNGRLIGILVVGSLLIKRGGTITEVTCPKYNITNVASGQTYVSGPVNKACSDTCVMFGEPIYNDDGTVSIEICDNKVLKFDKLFDLRGTLRGIDLSTASPNEVIDYIRSL